MGPPIPDSGAGALQQAEHDDMDDRVGRTGAEAEPASAARAAPLARRSRWRGRIVLAVVIAAGLGAGWYWWSRPAAPPAGRGGRSFQFPPQPVGAATVDTGDIRIVLNELGTVTSLATVTVKMQINGQLVAVGFTEGQQVKKGD